MHSEEAEFCEVRTRLENVVQRHLMRLADLASEEAGIIASGDNERILAMDKVIENVVGEKERALGGLNLHRSEHGC